MKVKYYKADDFLLIELSKKPFSYAEMVDGFVVHYTDNQEPVLIEVLEASRFLKATKKALPIEVQERIFASA